MTDTNSKTNDLIMTDTSVHYYYKVMMLDVHSSMFMINSILIAKREDYGKGQKDTQTKS